MIRHLPSIHTFLYHVCFLLLLFYSGKTSFYRLQVRLRLHVGYLFLSEARNKYNADTFRGGDDENEIELLWSLLDHRIVYLKLLNLCVAIVDLLHHWVKIIYDCYTKILELIVDDTVIMFS